jgi:hypothetical protein
MGDDRLVVAPAIEVADNHHQLAQHSLAQQREGDHDSKAIRPWSLTKPFGRRPAPAQAAEWSLPTQIDQVDVAHSQLVQALAQ